MTRWLVAFVAMGLSTGAYAADVDGDGFGAAVDCDDLDPRTYPGAPELADGKDNDCDGLIDEATYGTTWTTTGYAGSGSTGWTSPGGSGYGGYDADGDGYPRGVDCNDADATVYPGAPERPDGKDNDCDGLVDEGSSSVDDDRDGWSVGDGDCDDADPDVNPGHAEVPGNDKDDDCDGQIDEGGGGTTTSTGGTTDRSDDDGDDWTPAEGDCDDTNASVYPGAPERCDDVDNDCDGVIDPGCETTGTTGTITDPADDTGGGKPSGGCLGTGSAYALLLLPLFGRRRRQSAP